MSIAALRKPATDKPPRQRRWVPVSLRIFAALVAILGLFYVWALVRAYRQHVAIGEIERVGGTVGAPLTGPELLRRWLPPPWARDFCDVHWVHIDKAPIDDAWLANLKRLSGLKHLTLSRTKITDAGLVELESLTDLEAVSLDFADISNAGLPSLCRLPKLRYFSLAEARVTDAGIAELLGDRRLEGLDLNDTAVGDATLARLREQTEIKGLGFTGTKISDEGLAHIAGLTGLGQISIGNTAITDAGLEYLKNLTKMEILYLDGTKITGVLRRTQVTAAGVADLQRALPRVSIAYQSEDNGDE